MTNATDRFVEAAIRHGELRSGADANRAFDKIVSAYFEIRAEPDAGRSAFAMLAQHGDPSVARWAASFLLYDDPATARDVLERIARTEANLIGFSAEMTLSEWDAGRLTRPEDWDGTKPTG